MLTKKRPLTSQGIDKNIRGYPESGSETLYSPVANEVGSMHFRLASHKYIMLASRDFGSLVSLKCIVLSL